MTAFPIHCVSFLCLQANIALKFAMTPRGLSPSFVFGSTTKPSSKKRGPKTGSHVRAAAVECPSLAAHSIQRTSPSFCFVGDSWSVRGQARHASLSIQSLPVPGSWSGLSLTRATDSSGRLKITLLVENDQNSLQPFCCPAYYYLSPEPPKHLGRE